MKVNRVLSLTVMVALAIPTSVGNAELQQSGAEQDARIDLRWSRVFPVRQDPGGVSIAPHHSYALLSPRHNFDGIHIARYNHRGHEMWDHGWIGHHLPAVRSVVGEATAVSARHHAVLIAGHAICRYQDDDLRGLGPVFVRKYTLAGHRRWTRWIGTCPPRSSDRQEPALSVSGLDVGGDQAAISFTKGYSADCCVHHRKGYVALLGLDGSVRWRTRVGFELPRLDEVVTSDVAMSPRTLTVSGEVMWDSNGADGFLVNLSRASGSVRWRHVTSGTSEANNDGYQDLSAVGDLLFATGTLDDAFEGGGARGVLERWSTSGERVWRTVIRPYAQVSALKDRSAVWSVPHWRPKATHIVFARHRRDGTSAWKVRWPLAQGRLPVGYTVDVTRHFAFGAADVIDDNRDFLQIWTWHLR